MKTEKYYLLNITNDYLTFFKSICIKVGKVNYLTKGLPYIYQDIFTNVLIYPKPINKKVNVLTYSNIEKVNKEELENSLNYLSKEEIEKYYIKHIKNLIEVKEEINFKKRIKK